MREKKRKNLYKSKFSASATHNAEKLFKRFHTDFLAEETGIPASTLRSWKCRGTVSPYIATEVCKISDVSAAGFTRDKLRPDILAWYDEVR